MANVFDYLEWRGDLSFKTTKFNIVDNIIFSIISYYPFDTILPDILDNDGLCICDALYELSKVIDKPEIHNKLVFGQMQKDLITPLAAAERYKNMRLQYYKNIIDAEKELQFSAVTITGCGIPSYISFRGTDVTFVGWKEDFNMIFNDAIPAQLEAVKYLEKTASCIKGDFILGGHSKGGNLAVYAAAFSGEKIKKRITQIYSNDAPGFNKKIYESKNYKSIVDRIIRIVPQDSVVGLLFENKSDCKVVKSTETDLLQHIPFSWEVTKDNIVSMPYVTKKSRFLNKTLMDWLYGMDLQTRAVFIDTLYEILISTNAKTISDFTDNWLGKAITLIKSAQSIDKETQLMLHKTFSSLFECAKNNFSKVIKNKIIEGKR